MGREAELSFLNAALNHAQNSQGRAILLCGPTGSGKSVLLEATRQAGEARGFQVRQATATASAQDQAQATLALLFPEISHPGTTASEHDNAGPFGLAGATLNWIGVLKAQGPLLLLIDDAQWADRSTADILCFVARRIADQPVLLVIAVDSSRPGQASFTAALPEQINLEGLDQAAARELLDRVAHDLAPATRQRIHASAGGNPLALLELATAMDLHKGFPYAGTRLPVTPALIRALSPDTATLSAGAAAVLELCAADDQCPIPILLQTASRIADSAVTESHLDEATCHGQLLRRADRLGFRTPLVAAAVYASLPSQRRIALHRALAQELENHPEQQLLHRALSTDHPDPQLALDLGQEAGRLSALGNFRRAIDLYKQAVGLTRDPAQRTALLLRAAECAVDLGYKKELHAFLAGDELNGLSPEQQPRLLLVRELAGCVGHSQEGIGPAIDRLVDAGLAAADSGDTALAARLLRSAAHRCWLEGATLPQRLRVGTALNRIEPSVSQAVDAELLLARSQVLARESWRELSARSAQLKQSRGSDHNLARHLAGIDAMLGRAPEAWAGYGAAIRESDARGTLALSAGLRAQRSLLAIWVGEWDAAIVQAEAARDEATRANDPWWTAQALTALGYISGYRGDRAYALGMADALLTYVQSHGQGEIAAKVQRLKGLAYLGSGAPDRAYRELRQIFLPGTRGHHYGSQVWCLSDLADAAQAPAQREEARHLLTDFSSYADPGGNSVLDVTYRYARAVLDEETLAEANFTRALAADLGAWPFEKARLDLAYGTWLRRNLRRREAREPLQQALQTFSHFGATAWQERSRRELRAAGASQSEVDGVDLTPQQHRIASLAAQGLTNQQIGHLVGLSARTVGAHLYRVFPRLGVTQRSQLAEALGEPAPPQGNGNPTARQVD